MKAKFITAVIACALAALCLCGCPKKELPNEYDGGEITENETESEDEPIDAVITECENEAPVTHEIINRAGDIIIITEGEDGVFTDDEGRTFEWDGREDWICSDGSMWNYTLDDAPAD